MKKSLTLFACLFSVSAFIYSLEYTESSSGLETPAMESGRTELEMADVNQDGHIDILSIGDHGSPYINADEHGIMVWFGNGQGTWNFFGNGDFGYGGIAIGDINNDGHMDVGYGMHHNYSSSDFGDSIMEAALGDGTGQNWTPWDDGISTGGDWGMFNTLILPISTTMVIWISAASHSARMTAFISSSIMVMAPGIKVLDFWVEIRLCILFLMT